jgi:acyl-CoA hydrolase
METSIEPLLEPLQVALDGVDAIIPVNSGNVIVIESSTNGHPRTFVGVKVSVTNPAFNSADDGVYCTLKSVTFTE